MFESTICDENWKGIKDFDNYEISDQGRVKNIKLGKILKGSTPIQKDRTVKIINNCRQKKIIPIKMLVAAHF